MTFLPMFWCVVTLAFYFYFGVQNTFMSRMWYFLKTLLNLKKRHLFYSTLSFQIKNKASFWKLLKISWWELVNAFPFWKIYKNPKESNLLSKVVKNNVTLFIKGLDYQKDWVICWKNPYIIDLSELSQLLDGWSHFERNLQDNFLENFPNFCRVTHSARTEKSDFFAKVIMSLLSRLFE